MKDKDDAVPLCDADDALCAFLMEDAARMRRMVQLMPEQSPTAAFLNLLWEYAAKHRRLVDLANVLLGFDERHKTTDGNENCDWFCRCRLPVSPVQANDFFFELQIFARTRAWLEHGTYDDWHDNSLAMLEALEAYGREDVGKGIIGFGEVISRLREKYESEVDGEMQDGGEA